MHNQHARLHSLLPKTRVILALISGFLVNLSHAQQTTTPIPEVESATFGSGTFLLNNSVAFEVVLKGTVPLFITDPTPPYPATQGPYAYIVYAQGTDIYGNTVRIEVTRGLATGLRGEVVYDPLPLGGIDVATVAEPTTFPIKGSWTIPNDGTLYNVEGGYKLTVAIYPTATFPATFTDFNSPVLNPTSDAIYIDVTPDIAINSPGAIYQSGQYRGKDVVSMTTVWRNENRVLEAGRQSRPLRSNYSTDLYSIGLRLTTDPEFGGATSDDFRIYGLGGMAGDLAPYVADGSTEYRKIEVTDTPGRVPPYGIDDSTGFAAIPETIRDYITQAGDGFLDLGESVSYTSDVLIPENYRGRYFVASEVQASEVDGAPLDVNTGNNIFVSNADSKIEILETASQKIEAVSAVSDQNGAYVEGGNGVSDFASVTEDGSVVAFVSRANNLLTPAAGNSVGVATTNQQVFIKITQTREVELISGPKIGTIPADADCFNPKVSANGRFVAYNTAAKNILENESTSGRSMIYVFDRVTRETVIVSRNSFGELANGNSFMPSISENGRFVAFESMSSNLDPAKVSPVVTSGAITSYNVLRAGTGYRPGATPAVSVIAATGSGAAAAAVVGSSGGVSGITPVAAGAGYTAANSPVVRVAPTDQLYPPKAGMGQVYLHDRDTDGDGVFDESGKTATYLVSGRIQADGSVSVSDNLSYQPALALEDDSAEIAANGGVYVAFVSYASNLPDATGYSMVYRGLVDVANTATDLRGLKKIEAVSVNNAGEVPTLSAQEWNSGFRPNSYEPSINGDGSHIAFTSWGSNLVYNPSTGAYDADSNRVQDVFVRDFVTSSRPETKRISISEERVATGVIAFLSPAWLNLPMPGGTPAAHIPENQPTAGDKFEIGDGLDTYSFVFDPAGGPGVGEIAVPIGANVFETRDNLLVAINSSGLRIEALVSTPPSENPPGTAYTAALYLRNTVPGAGGNVPIVASSADGVLYADGMSGGGTQATDAPDAVQAVDFGSSQPSIDRSGRYVAFRTIAGNLDVHVRTESNNYAGSPITGELIRPLIWPTANVYVHDRLADGDLLAPLDLPGTYTTRRISVNKFGYPTYVTGGQQSGVNTNTAANNNSPAISAGGRFVAFSSDSSGIGGLLFAENNLQPLDNEPFRDVFLVDRRINGSEPPVPTTKPTVKLVSPDDGLRVQPGSTIALSATATAAPGKQISEVQFYINGTPYGSALTKEPYSLSYTLPTAGEYSVRAVATDSKGLTSYNAVTVRAVAPNGKAPNVSITQPSGNTRFVLGSLITLNAIVSDSDDSVVDSSVKFFINGTPLDAEPTGVPNTYTATYSPSTAGTFNVSASATDKAGNTTISVPIALTFLPSSLPLPSVDILELFPGTPTVAGGEVPLRAEVDFAGANTEDILVQFVANGAVIGVGDLQADGTYLLRWKTPSEPHSYVVFAYLLAPGASTSQGGDEEGDTFYYSALSSNFVTINTATGVAPVVRMLLPADGSTAGLNQALTLRASAGASPGVAEIKVTNGGSGYATAPVVTVSAPSAVGGVGATAAAVLGTGADAGKVVRIDVTNVGSGYSSVPTVSFSGGGGSGAAATAVVRTPTVASVQFYVNGETIGAPIVAQPYETTYTPASQGSYVFSAVATGADGLKSQPDSVVVVISGGQAPTVDISNPKPGVNYVSGTTIPVAASAQPVTSGARIASIEFFVDGVSLGLPDTQAPFTADLVIPGAGPHKLTAVATDNFGNVGAKSIDITSNNPDGGAPIVSINYPTPTPLDLPPGSEIWINAAAIAPNRTVKEIRFYVDGILKKETPMSGGQATAAYRYGQYDNADHVVVAEVIDSSNNAAFSAPLEIDAYTDLYYLAPTITLNKIEGIPAAGVTQGTSVYLVAEANAGLQAVRQVDFYANGIFIGAVANDGDPGTGVFRAVYEWQPLKSGDFEIYAAARVVATYANPAGNLTPIGAINDPYSIISSPSSPLKVIAPNLPPTIDFVSPADGASFSPNARVLAAVQASAAPGRQVKRVDFYVNGQPVLQDFAAPYTLPLTLSAIGEYQITAVVVDSASQTASDSITVKAFSPVGSEPVVSLFQPLPETNYVFGSVLPLNMSASDDAGINTNSTYFLLNGAPLKAKIGFGNVYTGQYVASSTTPSLQIASSAADLSGNTTVSGALDIQFAQATGLFPSIETVPLDPSATAVAGGLVQLRAKASFPLGAATNNLASSARVEFYADNVFIGVASLNSNAATTNSYTHVLDWRAPTNTAAVSYSISARVVAPNTSPQSGGATNSGASTTYFASVFSPTPVAVNVGTSAPPSVSITKPATDGTQIGLGVTSQIVATVTNLPAKASVKEVQFYVDGAFVGSDSTSPYIYNLTPSNAGSYSLAAVVVDNFGLRGSSTARTVNVVSGTPPSVSVISPVSTDQFFSGEPFTITGAAMGMGGASITRVEFFVNGFSIGADTDSFSPFTIAYTPPAPGAYTILARATDSRGNVADSTPVTLTIQGIDPDVAFTAQANVLNVFQKILSRVPTDAENQYWVNTLAGGGMAQSSMVMQLMASDEYNQLQNKLLGYYYKLNVTPTNSTYLQQIQFMESDRTLLVPPAGYPLVNSYDAPYGATTGDATAAQQIIASAAFAAANPGVQTKSRQDFMVWYFSRWPGAATGPSELLLAAMNSYAPSTEAKGYAASFINALNSVNGSGPGSAYDYQLKATSLQWLYTGIWAAPTVPPVTTLAQLEAFVTNLLDGVGSGSTAPRLYATSAIPGFSAVQGTPSAAQALYISAQNLTGQVTVTAPAGFQVSLNGSTFADSVQFAASAAQPVYVRVSALASAGSLRRSARISATGVAARDVLLEAEVSGNPFLPVVDGYFATFGDGVLDATFAAKNGLLSLTTRSDGSFGGSLSLNGAKHSFSGKFGPNKQGTVSVVRKGQSPVLLNLDFDTQRPTQKIVATVTVGDTVSAVVLLPRVFTGKAGFVHPKAGKRYSLALPAPDAGFTHGFASASVAPNGAVTIGGTLGDGTVFSTTSAAIDGDSDGIDGYWIVPIYAAPYGIGGCVTGEIYIAKDEGADNPDVTGNLAWIRPPVAAYPAGFRRALSPVGQAYALTSYISMISDTWSPAPFALKIDQRGLLLPSAIGQLGTWPASNLPSLSAPVVNGLSLVFTGSTGQFTGRLAVPAVSRKALPYRGVVFSEPVDLPGSLPLHGIGILDSPAGPVDVEITD